MKFKLAAIITIILLSYLNVELFAGEKGIEPWNKNQFYWQFKGKPTLLLGASGDDNLFQWEAEYLIDHLDSLQSVGGNYLRNTMSDRIDKGFEIKPFLLLENGKYNLDKWNKEYWERLDFFLKETEKRKIIVQIEIWDRFDHSRNNWERSAYNPSNNINYSNEQSGFQNTYSNHPGVNKQPFFFTVPDLDNNELILTHQKTFVQKLLSVASNYKNVLFCIDNETSGAEEWAIFWEEFIHQYYPKAIITEMWDQWDVKSDMHKRTIDHPDRYEFIDISQNSWKKGRENWENAQYVMDYIKDNPRPVNSTKIYGNDNHLLLSKGIGTAHAVNTFCRNILGGFASSRFHRPTHGQGLNAVSINCIKTIREIERYVKMWEINPDMQVLSLGGNVEAYVSSKPGRKYVIYFPEGGKTELDLTLYKKKYTLKWINTGDAIWRSKEKVKGGGKLVLNSNCKLSCFAVLIR